MLLFKFFINLVIVSFTDDSDINRTFIITINNPVFSNICPVKGIIAF